MPQQNCNRNHYECGQVGVKIRETRRKKNIQLVSHRTTVELEQPAKEPLLQYGSSLKGNLSTRCQCGKEVPVGHLGARKLGVQGKQDYVLPHIPGQNLKRPQLQQNRCLSRIMRIIQQNCAVTLPDVMISRLLCSVLQVLQEVPYRGSVRFVLVAFDQYSFSILRWFQCTAATLETNEDVQDKMAGVVTALAQQEGNGVVLRIGCFTSERVGPSHHPSAVTHTTVRSPSMCVPKVTTIRCHTLAFACSAKELDQWSPPHRRRNIIAPYRNHHSGGWERILRPLFINQDVFLLIGTCPAAISNKITFYVLVQGYWLD